VFVGVLQVLALQEVRPKNNQLPGDKDRNQYKIKSFCQQSGWSQPSFYSGSMIGNRALIEPSLRLRQE
jgi:hypothetical protein